MAKHTEILARALIVRSGAVLLCRNIKRGYYYLPGGHVEFGEAAGAALARELKEEAGVKARVGDLAAVSEASFKQGGKRRHEINLVFHVKLPRAVEVRSFESQIDFAWMRKSAIDGADIRPASAKRLLLSRLTGVRFDSDI